MDFYKKIIKKKTIRFRILSFLRFIPDKQMLQLQYWIKFGRKLDLVNPTRYTEKVQWYKLYYRNPLMQQCADKYQVRAYVKGKGLENILNDLYAIFPSPEEICLDQLPEQFVLKLSNGSRTNLLCYDKKTLDIASVKRKFQDFQRQADAAAGREWAYRGGSPVILAEKLLKDPNRPNGDLQDFKILCFGGKPVYIMCVEGCYEGRDNHILYDTNWNKINVAIGEPFMAAEYKKPDNLQELLQIAGVLSEDFPAVRVDLYSIAGKIYFGEMTFYSWSGYIQFQPDEFDKTMGDWFVLP